tara:strand:+ start:139 stop:684 length:546 start_codon:yes stop_codon:yes gene_type:complete
MPGKLIVGTIETQNINFDSDTTSMVINSTGHTRLAGNPCFGVRGITTLGSSNPGSYNSDYREIEAWEVTDVDRGGMIVNGRMQAPITGVYQFQVTTSRTKDLADQYRLLWVFKVAGGTWTGNQANEELAQHWTHNDYNRYTLCFSHIIQLSAGDQISVGMKADYQWDTDKAHCSFSGMLLG